MQGKMNIDNILCSRCGEWNWVFIQKGCYDCGSTEFTPIPNHIPDEQIGKWARSFKKKVSKKNENSIHS